MYSFSLIFAKLIVLILNIFFTGITNRDGNSIGAYYRSVMIKRKFIFILGCALFTVRWNTLNGKLTGLACAGCGVNIAYTTFYRLDKEIFVPRPFYIMATWLLLTAVKLMFFANPMLVLANPGKKGA